VIGWTLVVEKIRRVVVLWMDKERMEKNGGEE